MQNVSSIISKLKKEYPDSKYYLNFSNPLQLMVAAIMSAQVRDSVVNAATPTLFKKYKTSEDYANSSVTDIESIIKSVTFYKNKAKNIKEACRVLAEKHDGRVPKTMNELISLPGIGRKTANAILINAFGVVEGIPVDTHVIRLSQRLGWTKNKDPEKIEQDLMKIVPKSEWKTMPHLLKDHGRAVCTSAPKCDRCVLSKDCPKIGVS
jgi:endonuclease-3